MKIKLFDNLGGEMVLGDFDTLDVKAVVELLKEYPLIDPESELVHAYEGAELVYVDGHMELWVETTAREG